MSGPNDDFKDTGDVSAERFANPGSTQDDYVSRPGQNAAGIPVQSDNAPVEEGGYTNSAKADSDAQLKQDESDAIDKSNVMDSRTRGAKPEGTYTEPGDKEGLPENDGRSRIAQ